MPRITKNQIEEAARGLTLKRARMLKVIKDKPFISGTHLAQLCYPDSKSWKTASAIGRGGTTKSEGSALISSAGAQAGRLAVLGLVEDSQDGNVRVWRITDLGEKALDRWEEINHVNMKAVI